MIVIKCGMESEFSIARTYAPHLAMVLQGQQTVYTLEAQVPQGCDGIISFGLCGGLAPTAMVGQAFIYSRIVTPTGAIECDEKWRKAVFALTKYYECSCWSSGEFNTANSPAQRASLYNASGCAVIDDESVDVAEFAKKRGIPLLGLRVVSDGAEDNLPPAVVSALLSNGNFNIWAVINSVIQDPEQLPALDKTIGEYETSLAELRSAGRALGRTWGLS